MEVQFYLRFHTKFGQRLWISGNTEELGNDDLSKALAMDYLNEDFWHVKIEIRRRDVEKTIRYKYYLENKEGELLGEWSNDRLIEVSTKEVDEIQLTDTWNHAGEYENAFFSAPFKKVLLRSGGSKKKPSLDKHVTHIFKVKAPLLKKNEVVCLTGTGEAMTDWSTEKPLLLTLENEWWTIGVNLEDVNFPVAYKYGVFDIKENIFIRYEADDNRILYSDPSKKKVNILHDGFVHLPNNTWKGAGVAIPVFSLRTKNSFGVGEFSDIKLLVDWAVTTGLKLVQLLPINDTIANHDWMDSYPYAAISAFALHPLYINLSKVAGKENSKMVAALKKKQKQLNELAEVDYVEVIKFKSAMLKELYDAIGKPCLETKEYKDFFELNKHWLQPYAAFCFFRDKYGSSRYDQWKTNSVYNKADVDKLCSEKSSSYKSVCLYYFIQYHLHLQLKEAADYAHKKGVVLKGDIPIGIYRYGSDAWVAPEQYNMFWQAGAPPDDFAAVGQNWGFPTYNWKKMQEDGFAWWKQRFEQMSNYFDAFRIDHILGFFRIWSIPADATQGIMGRFDPCIPIYMVEFGENGIWFDHHRYCRPFVNDSILYEMFGDLADQVKSDFLVNNETGGYDLKPSFETQVQVQAHFDAVDASPTHERLRLGLLDLISNVILFEDKESAGDKFHFRIAMESTYSYKHLIPHVQEKMKALYVNYFYRRQDDFWFKEAMHKLPQLKAATNMLVCGEDLGMVPHCVPDVMKQLGILSLEIQRMPKDPLKEFFHPNDAPYMSVITPSTHDMSTIRGWWEENRERTQRFYNFQLGQWGDAPYFCEPWINRAMVIQHLYSPAMWAVFQMQDLFGMSDTLRRENPHDERINNPANPKNLWQYRMHIPLEQLIKETGFNEELKGYIVNSGRG